MSWLKKLWAAICGSVKTVVMAVVEAVGQRMKAIVEDTQLIELGVSAVEAAVKEGLTGDKAWVFARDKFTAALKEAGREMGDCAIDTALQVIYDGWKNREVK